MRANFAQTYILYTSTGGEYRILGFGLVQVIFGLFLGCFWVIFWAKIAIFRKKRQLIVLAQLYRINIFQ